MKIFSEELVEKAAGLLDGYGRIGCFLDRDEAGRRTLDALAKRYFFRIAYIVRVGSLFLAGLSLAYCQAGASGSKGRGHGI